MILSSGSSTFLAECNLQFVCPRRARRFRVEKHAGIVKNFTFRGRRGGGSGKRVSG
jgi:hypothetical protein